MNLQYNIPFGTPEKFTVVVEIPKGSVHKYEYDATLQVFRLDRILLPAMSYPGNYGFVPQTIAKDGDALDVLIVNADKIERGTIVECYALGALDMYDDGKRDVKVLAMPTFHHRRENFQGIHDFDPYFIEQVQHFFSHYKDFESKNVEVRGWLSPDETKAIVKNSNEAFGDYIKAIQESIYQQLGAMAEEGKKEKSTPKKKIIPPSSFDDGDDYPYNNNRITGLN